ncbi:hypothetical protein [Chryseosolibacter indicus]|uniref:DinB family protein n=1 Tax=Chryseosolibacter indicus TaxID=2782351 RepID=A0ABS5VW24_9BACT|nr:hypothetical protein [Chryseosolibacter indicus]MBT1705633.1 hypothetical protein [Chryseosolibacter indicus]
MNDRIVYPLMRLLDQLQQLLSCLDDAAYRSPVSVLSNASIGQHVRHIIEFFTALEHGYEGGYVNYDLRKRNKRIEADRMFAIASLTHIATGLNKADKPLWLVANFNDEMEQPHNVATNYTRELVHNLEHVVHHMAILRIGVQAVSALSLPQDFGVASSTMRHRKSSYVKIAIHRIG